MEEKNELNDIILNKGGSNTGSKKLLLAIATLTLVLIIVLVIMNSLKNDEVQKAPQAILPPEPTAPTEIINDPLFEPVEVIQEGTEPVQGEDLDKVAQKIKEESLQNTPVVPTYVEPAAVQPAPAQKTTIQSAPVAAKPVTVAPKPATVVAAPAPKVQTAPKVEKPVIKKAPVVAEKAPKSAEPKKTIKAAAVATSAKASTKDAAPAPAKAAEAKTSPAASNTQGTYYIQVGSFTKEPNKALFDRLNASGMKYTTQKSGETTKILVGPFQGEKAVQDALGTVRQNIEARAFKIKG
ncbi:MAG TPA: SPOR domain-containing protein [Sulfuricurvum sp.]|nr:SPOR domain-containing protein [Sulfuricurvum sp.]